MGRLVHAAFANALANAKPHQHVCKKPTLILRCCAPRHANRARAFEFAFVISAAVILLLFLALLSAPYAKFALLDRNCLHASNLTINDT